MGRKKAVQKNGFWNFIDNIEGDKVVWIIVFLLVIISVLAIFSSTPLLQDGSSDRIDIIKDHSIIVIFGLSVVFGLYKVPKIGWFKLFSQGGFLLSFILLLLLDAHVNLGFIRAQNINHAWRTLSVFGFQLHVFEVVKVAMVMYLAWALSAYKQDQEDMAKNRKKTKTFRFANFMATSETFAFLGTPFWKRMLYLYLPIIIVCGMTIIGSGSSAIFIGMILIVTLLIGGLPFKEIFIAIAAGVAALGLLIGIHTASDGKFIPRLATVLSRLQADYDTDDLNELKPGTREFFDVLDEIRQPYSAKIAVHEGRLIGKGSGNSTQKYVVSNIYGDYMFSFLLEEYGLIGGILVILLYVSLLARGSMIARLCSNEFAKIAVGGLSVLITGQAFMHMFVNVDIGPMTGQTLPLVSHGACAFLVFCIAFGIILSISRMASKRIREEEEAAAPLYESDRDDIQVTMDVLEQLDNFEKNDHEA